MSSSAINETERAVVLRIFDLAAIGYGQVHIAKILNETGAPAPRSQQGRPRAWVSSSVHEVLFRLKYRGEIVWNRTKKRARWGQHRVSDRREGQHVHVPAPHLRIVPEELWLAAHAKIATARSSTNLYRGRGSISRYLLPGLARCAWCNGGVHVRTRTRSGGRELRYYACTSHYLRGASVCANKVQVPMEAVDRAVLGSIRELLTPDIAHDVLTRVHELVDTQVASDPRVPVAAELADICARLANLAKAIAACGSLPEFIEDALALGARRQRLTELLESLPARLSTPAVDWRVLESQAYQMLDQWRALLADDVADARRVLRELLDGLLCFTPVIDKSVRFDGF